MKFGHPVCVRVCARACIYARVCTSQLAQMSHAL